MEIKVEGELIMEIYEVENLTIKLEEKTMFSNISLSLNSATINGIHGKKDSGKRLLLQCLSGQFNQGESDVKTFGELRNFSAQLVQLQDLLLDKTALSNMKILTLNQGSLSEDDLVWYLEKVGIDAKDDRAVKEYSKAEKLLLSLAVILSENPAIILFDEPFNQIEIQDLARFNDLLQQLIKMNFTLLISSQNNALLQPICEKIYSISAGNLVETNKI